MLKFELSKLIDYISTCGKCTIRIKSDDKVLNEFELKVLDNGAFNLSDDELKSLLAILYGEAFLSVKNFEGQTTFVDDTFKEYFESLDNALIVLDALSIYGFFLEVSVENLSDVDFNEIGQVSNAATKKLTEWVLKMLLYAKAVDGDKISMISIYDSLDEAFSKKFKSDWEELPIDQVIDFVDNEFIPTKIKNSIEEIRLNKITEKELRKVRELGKNTRACIDILAHLGILINENRFNDEEIERVKEEWGYYELNDESKKKLDDNIRELKEEQNGDGQKTI